MNYIELWKISNYLVFKFGIKTETDDGLLFDFTGYITRDEYVKWLIKITEDEITIESRPFLHCLSRSDIKPPQLKINEVVNSYNHLVNLIDSNYNTVKEYWKKNNEA